MRETFMFERYTDRARRVVVLAQEEARSAGLPEITPMLLLVAIAAEGECLAAKVLEQYGLDAGTLRRLLPAGPEQPTPDRPEPGQAGKVEAARAAMHRTLTGHIPFTDAAKDVLTGAVRESLQLGVNYISPDHILLAMMRLDRDTETDTRILPVEPESLAMVRASLVRWPRGWLGWS